MLIPRNKTEKKILDLWNDNPDFRKGLEEKFPEIFVDKTPAVTKGVLFLREAHHSNIYLVAYDKNKETFYIRNLKDDKKWTHDIEPSHRSQYTPTPYLNRRDFDDLLRKGGCSIDKIRIITGREIMRIHSDLIGKEPLL